MVLMHVYVIGTGCSMNFNDTCMIHVDKYIEYYFVFFFILLAFVKWYF